MNTSKLKTFAQETRKKLLKRVEERLDFVLKGNDSELLEQDVKTKKADLEKELARIGRIELIDKVAYTWFNRLVALRYMDVNDYQPFHVRIISPQEGFTEPQILSDAKQGIIPDDFKVDRTKINQLLDGTLDSQNPQNEVFKLLLVAACNNLHSIFPFLFEPIADYSELLLPADLISEHSVIHDVVEGMTDDDCQQVEILGWLYQFYISKKKKDVDDKSGRVLKEEIPAVTQLFTPRWIVEYMVQNTVGKLWVLNHPNSRLKEHMEYYIESEVTAEDVLTIDKPEELTLLDQACGSGHILVYGFELLYKIYEEEGYAQSDIPRLIIEHNLHGFEIDQRASQLAGLAILMKAREHQRRLFRKSDVPEPNITCFEDLTLSDEEIKATLKSAGVDVSDELLHDLLNMQQATNFGSLIVPHASLQELGKTKAACEQAMGSTDLFEKEKLEQLTIGLETLEKLGTEVCCVVDNPPYMGSGKMNKRLSKFVQNNYSVCKYDLMACFMVSGYKSLRKKGLLGMINQQVWMFSSRYEKFRKKFLSKNFFDTLLQLGPRTFPEISGEVVQNTTFTVINELVEKKGRYFRLVDFEDSELKRIKVLEAVNDPGNKWLYEFDQKHFDRIPGSPLGYWCNEKILSVFNSDIKVESILNTREGLATAGNDRFLRFWNEVRISSISFKNNDLEKSWTYKWFPYIKGGTFRRWYGNFDYIVNWYKDGEEIRNNIDLNTGRVRSHNYNGEYAFRKGVTWSGISSSNLSMRLVPNGFMFDAKGPMGFTKKDEDLHLILSLLNSKVASLLLKVLAPTLDYKLGHVLNLPLKKSVDVGNKNLVSIAKQDWDSRETSWDFKQNELIRFNKEGGIETLEEAYDHYKQFWQNKFYQLHQNEEKLNRQFIEIYELLEELTPDVPLDEIMILQEELDGKRLKKLDKEFRGRKTGDRMFMPALPYKDKEVMAQFISYAVGCMFGRYSLDKEGLILANQGETLEDYLQKTELSKDEATFLPDKDNIIPALEDDWFEDDLTGLFYRFLRASFGEQNFEKNLAFIEDKLGRDIRTWFSKYFYKDHTKRYNNRPIYWQFSSENGVFKALIYMHRYTPDTLNHILNGYLRDFKSKLNYQKSHLQDVIDTSQDAKEVNKAEKEQRNVESMIEELETYEREVLMPLATLNPRISIDLDDGVLVNYNKFGQAVEVVKSLNNPKKKKKVKEFDWVDGSEIR